jgi:exodeoxyribonuclease V alpha subunit
MRPRDIQVITVTKNGPYGTLALNTKLQNEINPPADGKTQIQDWQGRIFRVGDKVMQTKNNYQLEWKSTQDFSDGIGVFNGEIGEIENIDLERKQISVIYDETRYVNYEPDQWINLDLAYAITVHKSQGSEFSGIIMPLAWTTPKLAHRNLLYTAITRGRDKVVLVGSEKMLQSMVDNYQGDQRQTGLTYRLGSGGAL